MSSPKPDFDSTNDNSDTWYDRSLLERNQIVIELIHNQIQKAEPLLISPLLMAADLVKETKFIIPDFTFPKEENNNNNKKSKGKYFLYISGTDTSGRETFTDLSQCESNVKREDKNDEVKVGRSNNGGSLQEKPTEQEKCNPQQSTIHINFNEGERENTESKKSSVDDNEDSTTKIVKLLENNIDAICRCGPSIIREYQFHDYFKPSEEASNREAEEGPFPEMRTVNSMEEQTSMPLNELKKDSVALSNTANGAHLQPANKVPSTNRGKYTMIVQQKLNHLRPVTLKNIKRKIAVDKVWNMKPKSGKPKVINTEWKSSFGKLPPISQRRKNVETDKDRKMYRPATKSIKILRNNDEPRNQKGIILPAIASKISSPTSKVRDNSKISSANKGRFMKKSPTLYDISRIARLHELQESVSSNLKSKKGVKFQAVVPSSTILNTRDVKVSFTNVQNAKLGGRLPTHLPPLSPQIVSHTTILPVNTYKCRRKWLQPILNTTLNSFS